MSTREIEECFYNEWLDPTYESFISITVDSSIMLIVYDPYMINTEDMLNIKIGVPSLVRARRPAWGVGNLNKYIFLLSEKPANINSSKEED